MCCRACLPRLAASRLCRRAVRSYSGPAEAAVPTEERLAAEARVGRSMRRPLDPDARSLEQYIHTRATLCVMVLPRSMASLAEIIAHAELLV
jgi:hypothetical protein